MGDISIKIIKEIFIVFFYFSPPTHVFTAGLKDNHSPQLDRYFCKPAKNYRNLLPFSKIHTLSLTTPLLSAAPNINVSISRQLNSRDVNRRFRALGNKIRSEGDHSLPYYRICSERIPASLPLSFSANHFCSFRFRTLRIFRGNSLLLQQR